MYKRSVYEEAPSGRELSPKVTEGAIGRSARDICKIPIICKSSFELMPKAAFLVLIFPM